MTTNMQISAFFPAYNEAKNLPLLIADINDVLKSIASEYEIIIVNDGSTDDTDRVISELQNKYNYLRSIKHEKNLGYGAAIIDGFKASRMPIIFYSDADRQFDFNDLKRLITYLDEADVVVGYRAPRADPIIRIFCGKLWNSLINLLFKTSIKDIDCAFKLFKRDALNKIDIDSLTSQGAMISPELIIKLFKGGAKIIQQPVQHQPRVHGQATGIKPKVILKALKEIMNFYQDQRKKN